MKLVGAAVTAVASHQKLNKTTEKIVQGGTCRFVVLFTFSLVSAHLAS